MEHYFPMRAPDQKANERRRAGRIRCEGTICQFGKVIDFSRTGVKVLSKKKIAMPSDKFTNLELVCANTALIVPARLISCRKHDAGGYVCGFEIPDREPTWTSALVLFSQIAASTDGCLHRRMRAG